MFFILSSIVAKCLVTSKNDAFRNLKDTVYLLQTGKVSEGCLYRTAYFGNESCSLNQSLLEFKANLLKQIIVKIQIIETLFHKHNEIIGTILTVMKF